MSKEERVISIIRNCFSELREEFNVEQETEDYVEELILKELENADN